jgi:hypothetical protein
MSCQSYSIEDYKVEEIVSFSHYPTHRQSMSLQSSSDSHATYWSGQQPPPSQPALTMARPPATPITAQPAHVHLPFSPEIRDRIYKFVLIMEYNPKYALDDDDCMPGPRRVSFAEEPSKGRSKKSPHDDKYFWSRVKGPDKRPLSLLLVSKQTYREAYHIFYRHNNLQFLNVCYLWKFLKNIGYARRQYVTHITFVWMGLEASAAFGLLQRCPRLKFLDIILPCRLGLTRCRPCHSHSYNMLCEVRGLEAVNFKYDEDHKKHTTRYSPGYSSAVHAVREEREWNKEIRIIEKLQHDMMRPRLKRFLIKADEKINLFKPKKERHRRSEVHSLRTGEKICPIGGYPVKSAYSREEMEICRREWREKRQGSAR